MATDDRPLRVYRSVLPLLFGVAACSGDDQPAKWSQLDALAQADGIEIVTFDPQLPRDTRGGRLDGVRAGRVEIAGYVDLFVEEWSLYPRHLLTCAQLQRVVLCKQLSLAGQPRAAIPDYLSGTLYLDVSRGDYDRAYMRSVIHHDFFHIIDFRDDGSLVDEHWQALNPPSFTYGGGGVTAQGDRAASLLTDEFPGFLSRYAMSGVEEDKAVLFATLMVDPAYVETRARADLVIEAKVARLKQSVLDFCPGLENGFWQTVRARRSASPAATQVEETRDVAVLTDPREPAKPIGAQSTEPLLISGRALRPDGSPLPNVQVSLWASDATGEPSEVLAHAETASDGSFEISSGAILGRVSRVRFRWQPMRVARMFDLATASPFGTPIDVWLDRSTIADWSAVTAVVDSGWTISGLVSTSRKPGLVAVQVIERPSGRICGVAGDGTFVFADIPWAVETCTIEVYSRGAQVAAVEVHRPDSGGREIWTDVVVR